MIGTIEGIIYYAPKKRRINIEINGRHCRTHIVKSNKNSKQWSRVEVGDKLDNLEWFDKESGIIDADSKIKILK